MRRLFEYEPFHVVQTIFPYAYIVLGGRRARQDAETATQVKEAGLDELAS